jgi:hypothetical protein
MNNVEFDNEVVDKKLLYAKFDFSSEEPAIVTFLLKNKIVKSERQANVLLQSLIVLSIICSIVLFRSASTEKVFTPDQVIQYNLYK